MFKTQKLLGSRALVTDSWSRHSVFLNSQPAHAGVGQYAHRDGYNVLHGDWSDKWYGDPQTRIMWWPDNNASTGASGSAEFARIHSLAVSTVAQWAALSAPTTWYPEAATAGHGATDPEKDGATVAIWNLFDQSKGVDVP